MVDPERDDSPLSPDSLEDAETPDDSAVEDTSESAEDARIRAREKQLSDRLAEQGRRTAAAEQRAEQAAQAVVTQNQQIQALQQQLGRVGSYITQEQQRQNEAMLASLPPERRMEVKIQQLERQIAGAQRQPMPTPQPQTQRGPSPAQIEARKQEILQEVSREFGIRLTGQEQYIDHDSEAGYRASLRSIAAYARDIEEDTPAQERPTVAAKKTPKTLTQEQIVEESSKRVLQELGVTRSGAPSAVAAIAAPTSDTDIQKIMKSGSSREGPHKRLEALRKATGRS